MTQAIFLSYASQDANAARRICEALRAAGLEVWFDQNELRGGDAWDASIRKQIKECALFVPIISANTDARPEGYFRLEWKLAVDRSHLMADDQPFFVPVILGETTEPTARVPEKFRERHWTRLNDDGAITAFAERVSKLIGGSASSGKNASSSPSNGEFIAVATASKTVAPTQVGAQVPPSAQEQTNLDPDLHRDSRLSGSARASDGKSSNTVAAKGTTTNPVAASPTSRRSAVITTVAIVFALACAATAWFVIEQQRNAAFVIQSITKIEDLTRSTRYVEASRLASEVVRAGGEKAIPDTLRDSFSLVVDVSSTPEGASVAYRAYDTQGKESGWVQAGNAPLTKLRVPRGVLEWKAQSPQGQTHVLTTAQWPTNLQSSAERKVAFAFPDGNNINVGMVPIPAGDSNTGGLWGVTASRGVKLSAFWIDRTEVTNRQFAEFVKAGGYSRQEYWPPSFLSNGKSLSFAEAMARFKDTTGRTGPATWRLGSYPDGEADLPVRGVSWYEANAYATFAGKALPSVYHWYFADSGNDTWVLLPAILPRANFGGKAPRPSSANSVVSRFGAVDMAGNVREWVANSTDKGRKVTVGGSWQEAAYQYKYTTPLDAFERANDVGFRCISKAPESTEGNAYAALPERVVDRPKNTAPISASDYAIYLRMLGEGTAPLDARVEATDDTKPHWTRIKLNYATGYGNERMQAFLYLPKNAAPPYQVVVYFPGSLALRTYKPFEQIGETAVSPWILPEMLVRGGRAVLYPIWNGTFERSAEFRFYSPEGREIIARWASELRQSAELLRTRPDIDASRVGYFGFSLGVQSGVPILVTEPRVKAAVFLAGGIDGEGATGLSAPPEIDAATYAPGLKIPVLMLNGRSDIRFPYETSQVPLFNLLGSPPDKKKHKTYPGGHLVLGWYDEMVRDTHDWFDLQLGPVKPAAPGANK